MSESKFKSGDVCTCVSPEGERHTVKILAIDQNSGVVLTRSVNDKSLIIITKVGKLEPIESVENEQSMDEFMAEQRDKCSKCSGKDMCPVYALIELADAMDEQLEKLKSHNLDSNVN